MISGSASRPESVSAAAVASLKSMAAAVFLPTISASVVRLRTMLFRKVISSFAVNAAQASKSAALLVSMRISICLCRIEMFLKPSMRLATLSFHDIRHAEKFGTDLQVDSLGGREIDLKPQV